MTDLPQLERMLVDAAARHGRRRRVATAARPLVVLAALVLVAAAGALALSRGAEEPEVPAGERGRPQSLEQVFAVFRRPERPSDRITGRTPRSSFKRTRLVARTRGTRVYLADAGRDLCLVTATHKRGGSLGCGPLSTYFDGRRPMGTHSDQRGRSLIAFAFPDGVREARLTLEDGTTFTYEVRDNAFAAHVASRPAWLDWRDPKGRPAQIVFTPEPVSLARDFYGDLKRPPVAGDDLRSLPGSRLVARAADVHAWLVPRRGAVCLVVTSSDGEVSGCRHKVADVRRPLIAGIGPTDRSRRVVVAVFPNGVERVSVHRPDRIETRPLDGHAIAIPDALDVDAISYRSPARTRFTDRMPASATTFVLNARPERPEALPPP